MRAERVEKLFWYSGWLYDFTKIATIILVLGLLVNYFFFSFLVVRGKSMYPSYKDGDVMLVNKLAYITSSPKRGDVVGMYFPGETQRRFIKRVIGLPGETVKVASGKVYINGVQLNEPYLSSDITTTPDLERTLQSGEYFVFGDNRPDSSDSRAWGSVPQSFIVGKAVHKLFSLPSQNSVD